MKEDHNDLTYFIMDKDHEMLGGALNKTFSGNWTWSTCSRPTTANDSMKGVGAKNKRGHTVGVLTGSIIDGAFLSHGTFVSRQYRGQRVASRLWALLMSTFRPREVHSCAVSDKGWTLLNKLRDQYRDVVWDINDDGERPLRILRRVA
jgi:isopentenyldiphosphate isomerase